MRPSLRRQPQPKTAPELPVHSTGRATSDWEGLLKPFQPKGRCAPDVMCVTTLDRMVVKGKESENNADKRLQIDKDETGPKKKRIAPERRIEIPSP
ncbi:hypothetical protein NDU88_001400 [Pleurodeles waltl]|uniref:Uncharacterized protein n=1 Tax=Pleurodeles waltl TaxID=8319 RepID=A0AAV7TJZ4_PLEWA|nr:hypothetical protein NDU88_001400 [Pleurodeles waltl]